MINVDISNIWGQASLSDLLGIEQEIFAAHQRLTASDGPEAKNFRWQDLPDFPTEEILSAAEKIRQDSDVLVVLGDTPLCASIRGVLELLQGPDRNLGKGKPDPQILFAGTGFSTRRLQQLVKLLEGKDVSLCLLADPLNSPGTDIFFQELKWLLERRYGTDGARQRIYVAAGEPEDPIQQTAQAQGWVRFPISRDLPEAFSLLSPAGLLPLAAGGIQISRLLQGAREAREALNLRSYENPAWLYAASRNILLRSGCALEVLTSFEPGFSAMAQWWHQIFCIAEKNSLFPVTGAFPSPLCSRLMYSNVRNSLETLVRFDPAPLKDLSGRSLEHQETEFIQTSLDVQADNGVCLITLDCGPLREETAGELVWFFQLSCALSALTLNASRE